MAGLFAFSINPEKYKDNFSKDFLLGTFYQQHLGEECSGLATCKDGTIYSEALPGHFRHNFQDKLDNLEGTEAIGYCGPSKEPFEQQTNLGQIVACFSGNILNCSHLVKEFMSFGHTLERGDDIEVIVKLVAQGRDIVDGLTCMSEKIQGSYALLLLNEEGLYATSFPGHWPLIVGKKEGAIAIATDPSGFNNLGFKIQRDLKPGEIVLIKNGTIETKNIISQAQGRVCSFKFVYSDFPAGVFRGIPYSLVRKKLGAALARRDIEKGFLPDIVASVPDSGRSHAIGYYQELCRQINEGNISKIPLYDELLLKYPYSGRSFIPQDEEERYEKAQIKLLRSSESYQGMVVVIVDDSIVRGTQAQTNLVPKLRDLGLAEIHFRISNPELLSHCPWGKTTKDEELFAARFSSTKERIEFLGIKSLEYNTIEDLVEAIGLPPEVLCLDCSLSQS